MGLKVPTLSSLGLSGDQLHPEARGPHIKLPH